MRTAAVSIVLQWGLAYNDATLVDYIDEQSEIYEMASSQPDEMVQYNFLLISRNSAEVDEFLTWLSPEKSPVVSQQSPLLSFCSVSNTTICTKMEANIWILSELSMLGPETFKASELEAFDYIVCTGPAGDTSIQAFLEWNISSDYSKYVMFFAVEENSERAKGALVSSAPCLFGSLFQRNPIAGWIMFSGAAFQTRELAIKAFHCSLRQNPSIYALFGPSQSGKSAFVNALAGRHLAREGNGSGISETKECTEYNFTTPEGLKLVILDVPGLDDNFYNTTDEEIMGMIRKKIQNHLAALALENGLRRDWIDGILLFEPLDYDYCRVNKTVASAKLLFGQAVMESAAVIFTKSDIDFRREPEQVSMLSSQWQSYPARARSDMSCLPNLISVLNDLTPYVLENMKEVLQRLNSLTNSAYKNQKPEYQTVTIPTKEKVHVANRVTRTTKYKPPVLKQRSVQVPLTTDVLVRPAHSFEMMKSYCFHQYFTKPSAIQDLRIISFDPFRCLLHSHATIAAEVAMEANESNHGHSRGALFLELCRQRIPHNQYNDNIRSILWGIVSECYQVYGCGRPIYRQKTEMVNSQESYMYREPYVEVTTTPIFEDKDIYVSKKVQKPLRDVGEFLDEAKQALISELKTTVCNGNKPGTGK